MFTISLYIFYIVYMSITPSQIRAARALQNWSQADLARKSGLATPSIANIELGKQQPSLKTLELLIRCFEDSGIEFTAHDGVQRKTGSVQVYSGRAGFRQFLTDVDFCASSHQNSTFKVTNVDERQFIRWLEPEDITAHTNAMQANNVHYRIIVKEGDDYTPASPYATYRWADPAQFYSLPLYIYGSKVAFIGFEPENVSVFVIHHPVIAGLCELQFDEMWERTRPMGKPGRRKI